MSEHTNAEIQDGSRGLSLHQDSGAQGLTRPTWNEQDGGRSATRPTEGGGAQGLTRPTLRLAPVAVVAREKMSVGQLMQAQRDHQAGISLEAEIRQLARELGLDAKEATQIAEASRAGFRIVKGEPIPVAGDRHTVLLGADGVNVMSVAEWVERNAKLKIKNEKWDSREDEVLPMRNPFRRKTWNLTEQMRLMRRDPKLAKRFKAEAYAAGES